MDKVGWGSCVQAL